MAALSTRAAAAASVSFSSKPLIALSYRKLALIVGGHVIVRGSPTQ